MLTFSISSGENPNFSYELGYMVNNTNFPGQRHEFSWSPKNDQILNIFLIFRNWTVRFIVNTAIILRTFVPQIQYLLRALEPKTPDKEFKSFLNFS